MIFALDFARKAKWVTHSRSQVDGGIQELVGIGKHHEFRPFGQVPAKVVKHFVNLLDGA